jgi:hypothetical protein
VEASELSLKQRFQREKEISAYGNEVRASLLIVIIRRPASASCSKVLSFQFSVYSHVAWEESNKEERLQINWLSSDHLQGRKETAGLFA